MPYFARLLCLCSAAFFLAHASLVAAAATLAPYVLRRASRMRPNAGARLLFAWRMLPATVAGVIVAGLCAPAYLVFEPDAAHERLGSMCLAAAALGVWVCGSGLLRGIAAAVRSSRFVRTAQQTDAPMLMLVGVFRPRLVVSGVVRDALKPDQLAAALRHERAHEAARDNLKRLAILLTPDALPFVRGLQAVERGWKRLAEWAADDRASRGSRRRALAMASALVTVARLGSPPPTAVATNLIGDPGDLAARVDRLLQPRTGPGRRPRVWPGVLTAVCAAAAAFQAPPLWRVHEMLEALAR